MQCKIISNPTPDIFPFPFLCSFFLIYSSLNYPKIPVKAPIQTYDVPISTDNSWLLNCLSDTGAACTPSFSQIRPVSSGWLEPPKIFVFLMVCSPLLCCAGDAGLEAIVL